jgi:hypothetical protein
VAQRELLHYWPRWQSSRGEERGEREVGEEVLKRMERLDPSVVVEME